MEEQPKPQISKQEKAKWDKAIEKQQRLANNPTPRETAEEFQKKISTISPNELLRQFDI
jgi:hypothetical protein